MENIKIEFIVTEYHEGGVTTTTCPSYKNAMEVIENAKFNDLEYTFKAVFTNSQGETKSIPNPTKAKFNMFLKLPIWQEFLKA